VAGTLEPFILVGADHTWNTINEPFFSQMFLPAVLEFSGVQTIKKSMSVFGGGAVFANYANVKTDGVTAALNVTGLFALLEQAVYEIATLNGTFSGHFVGVGHIPVFTASGGATGDGSGASVSAVFSALTIDAASVTVGKRSGMTVGEATGAGAVTSQIGIIIENLVKGASSNIDLLMGTATPVAGNWGKYQTHEKPDRHNGGQQWKARAVTTSSRTLDRTVHNVFVNYNGTCTITLPSAAGIAGREYLIKNIHATGTVNINSTSSQYMDGDNTNPVYTLATQFKYVRAVSDGAQWLITGSN